MATSKTHMDALIKRALAAYFRHSQGDVITQPSADSREQEHNGRQYIVLRNARGVVAVYRVRNHGMLKRLKRWPKALD